MISLPAVPGFWADCYVCRKDSILETINYMLNLHAADKETACVGFTITNTDELTKIYPKVRRNKKDDIYDFYTNKIIKLQKENKK